MNIKNITSKYKDYVVEKRRYFHMNPEPSWKEFNTSKVVREELDKLGIEYTVACETGVIAKIKGGKPGKTVLLRADMDALEIEEEASHEYKSVKEGLMHACGHDGHTAMLLGAAHVLMEIREELEGDVVLLFQPAEEVAGAKKLIDETNIIDEIDAAFAIHLWQGVEAGKVSVEAGPRMAAADFFEIKIKGKGGHGSMPHECVDACVVAASIVMNLQSLVSRGVNPLDTLVLTIGKIDVGTRFNVIPGEGFMYGTTRSFSKDIWERIPDDINRVIKNTAAAYGAEAELSMDRATIALWNNPDISNLLSKSATKLYGEDVLVEYEKTTGGEDFAFFTDKVPGALAFVGIRNDEKGLNAPHHNCKFDIDEDALEIGTNLYAQFAYDYLKENK